MLITSLSLGSSSAGHDAERPGAYDPDRRDQGRVPERETRLVRLVKDLGWRGDRDITPWCRSGGRRLAYCQRSPAPSVTVTTEPAETWNLAERLPCLGDLLVGRLFAVKMTGR